MTTNVDNTKRLSVQVPYGFYHTDAYVGVPATDLGDATAAQVLSGKTFTSSNGLKLTGTMNAGVTVQKKSGTFRTNSSGEATVDCGFKPDLLFLNNGGTDTFSGYKYYMSATFAFEAESRTDDMMNLAMWAGSSSSSYEIIDFCAEPTSTGFNVWVQALDSSWNNYDYSGSFNYVAVKYT